MKGDLSSLHRAAQQLVSTLTEGGDPANPIAQRALFMKLLEQHIAILGKTGCGKTFTANPFAVKVFPQPVLQHIAILGKTGCGKTFTAKGFAELLLAKKQRVCILDPTGVWWGLRSDKTGKRPAFPIYVFGGEHADLPLDPHAWATLVAAWEDL